MTKPVACAIRLCSSTPESGAVTCDRSPSVRPEPARPRSPWFGGLFFARSVLAEHGEKILQLKTGRPSAWQDRFWDDVPDLIRQTGMDFSALAKVLGVGERSLYRWQAERPEWAEAIHEAKLDYLEKLSLSSLKTRIAGKRYEEVTREPDEDGNLRVVKRVTKEIQPSDAAIMYALDNVGVRRGTWRNQRFVRHEDPGREALSESLARLLDGVRQFAQAKQAAGPERLPGHPGEREG